MHQAVMLAVVAAEETLYESSNEASIAVSVVAVGGPVEGVAVRVEVTNTEGNRLDVEV